MVDVILLVTFELTRQGGRKIGSVRYARTIQIPEAPNHLDLIIVNVHTLPAHVQPKHVAWSQPREAYVVTCTATEDEQILQRLAADEHWVEMK